MLIETCLLFVDGENLWFRYHEMVKEGWKPRSDNQEAPGAFIWNPTICTNLHFNVSRATYYTSVVGDDDLLQSVRLAIRSHRFQTNVSYKDGSPSYPTRQERVFLPEVRKKAKASHKESLCDISMAVDILRASYRDHAQRIWIVSGDGDFLPLIREVRHTGKQVFLSALSSGLAPSLQTEVDKFDVLDESFFERRK